MEHLLHGLGELAHDNLPETLATWVFVLLGLVFVAHWLATEAQPDTRKVGLPAVVVAIVVWLGLGTGTMDQAKKFCHGVRGTGEYVTQHCGNIDPADNSFPGL